MKNKKIISIFLSILIILVISILLLIVNNNYLKSQIEDKDNEINSKQQKLNDAEVEIYNANDPNNLKIKDNLLDEYLFTDKNYKQIYDGGPAHWGSRDITVKSVEESDTTKIVILDVTDQSNLKDGTKKTWTEDWKLTPTGLYIDNMLMIKLPLSVGNNWTVKDYIPPITISDKKSYDATVEITNISKVMDKDTKLLKQITTVLTIDDVTIAGGRKYSETTVYETGKGIVKKTITEPNVADLDLQYFLNSRDLK